MNQVLLMMAALYGLGFANIFLRSTMGVMAPELSRELEFSPATLGAIASAFFIAYALMQIPAGMLSGFGQESAGDAAGPGWDSGGLRAGIGRD